ncbi:MAG TPA: high-affinity nickel-transport family protein [Polyangia bacterium]|nr:high-affinity nickel-transport family protein [Polyangia bacterium]
MLVLGRAAVTASPVALLLLGVLMGMRHATDPDHVVAMTTIITREPRKRSAIAAGAAWGVGHTATILLFGGAIILCGAAIPPRLGLALEMVVALMLILLGAFNLVRRAPRGRHPHVHAGAGPGAGRGLRRGFFVGVVHGLAGSAAVALLVLSTIQSHGWALVYLAIFGAGTVLGMMTLTAAMTLSLAAVSRRSGAIDRALTALSGVASIAFGLVLCYRLTLVDGLFSELPRWTPR